MEGAWWSKDTVAVVSGANKGVGYEIVRQLAEKGVTVVLTARDPKRGKSAVDALKAEGLNSVVFHQLEVSSKESVDKLAQWLNSEFGGFDILVNNAGILHTTFTYELAKNIVGTNYFGTTTVTEGLLPLMRASPAGARIVMVSARLGEYERLPGEPLKHKFRDQANYSKAVSDSLATKYLEDVKAGRADEEGWLHPGSFGVMYSESKMFLSVYTIALSKSLLKSQSEDHQIMVVTMCPGPTLTEMFDTSMANRDKTAIPPGYEIKTAAEGADTAVWLALMPKAELLEKNGKFFGERQEYAFGWPDHPF